MMHTEMGSSRRQASLLALVALCFTGCVGEPAELGDELLAEVDGVDEDVSTETSELKNGTVFTGSGTSRGAVLLEIYWPPFDFWTKCSGQIVSRQTILTAAHCVYGVGQNGGATWIRASRQTSSGWVDVISSTWTTVVWNKDYDGTARNDIGLIIAPTVTPLVGAVRSDAAVMAKSTPSGVNMTAFGFGYYTDTLFDGKGRSGVVTPTYNAAVPEYYFSGSSTSPKICTGDSGGPLKSTHNGLLWQYGIASWGSAGNGECRRDAHWTTTARHIAWLKANIRPDTCLETATNLSCW
jgi:Trypsin